MQSTYNYLPFLALACLMLTACEVEEISGPTGEDHFLNYEVPVEPVDQDYNVGAFYFFQNQIPSVQYTPSVGSYNAQQLRNVYGRHVAQAQAAGVDFFVFDQRRQGNFRQDSTFIANLIRAEGGEEMKFALSINVVNLNFDAPAQVAGITQELTNLADGFFSRDNYATTDDGRPIIYFSQGVTIFTNGDYANVMRPVRDALSAVGIDAYIIAEQQSWQPAQRFLDRVATNFDAVAQTSYANPIFPAFYDRYILFENIVDQAYEYNSNIFEMAGLDYITTISPSYDITVQNANSNNFVFPKDSFGVDFFFESANLARRHTTDNIVLIDSWNNFNQDSQIEATEEYGTLYLDAVREAFTPN